MIHRFAIFSLSTLALALAACGEQASEPRIDTPDEAVAPAIDATPERAAERPGDGAPALVSETESGETGARDVLLSFARAIELEEFDRAYTMLGDAAPRGMTRAGFADMFDGFGAITVAVPGGRMEGAAGSLYYEVPTTITGSEGQRLTGTTILRRVNDVPGATPEQLRWHIERFEVSPG